MIRKKADILAVRLYRCLVSAGIIALAGTPAVACMPLARELSFSEHVTALPDHDPNIDQLDEFASFHLTEDAQGAVRVVAFFDLAHDPAASMQEALERATWVRFYLAARGLPEQSLRVVLLGEERTAAPEMSNLVRVLEEPTLAGSLSAGGIVPTC